MIVRSPCLSKVVHHLWLWCQKQTYFKIRCWFRMLNKNKKTLMFTSSHTKNNNWIISWFSDGFFRKWWGFLQCYRILWSKIKSHDTTMEKKIVKEPPSRIKDILWNKWIYSKKYHRSEFMQWPKKDIKKLEKFLSLLFKEWIKRRGIQLSVIISIIKWTFTIEEVF